MLDSSVADIYPLHNLLSASQQMSESSLKVAKFIVENPKRVASMSIGELAKATGSNKTAVVRVSKLSGYKGYRGLRIALIENRGVLRGAELIEGDFPRPGLEETDNLLCLAREAVRINIEVLQDTLTLLDEGTLLRAVENISRAKHVFLIGFGTSAPVVQDAYQRFLRLQVPSSPCSDAHVLASIIVNMRPEDLLFCLSYDGSSRDIVEALETARRRKISTITMTSLPKSAAAQLSETVLVSAVRRTPRTTETVAARVAQFAIVDMICAIIARRKMKEFGKPTERIAAEPRNKSI
ncbi:MAG: MurR/RpiR family transcriptional regulator [Verrucomicrobia bacterium]|nr:MurR/RpiR family transcriptional regulator [Verrucomicrobiota bacterium]